MIYRYIVQSTERQDDVLLLTLQPTAVPMSFEPGQYAAISFRRGGRPTPARCFSIISTPRSGVLQFAMRVKGNFTRVAADIRTGDLVEVQGPFGDFTVNSSYDRRIVMLAGGIGITPFLSMIRDLTERRAAVPVTVLYANRSAAHIPFKAALHTLAKQNRYLQIRLFSNDVTGQITEEHIRQLAAKHSNDTTYFVCGPKAFSRNMQRALTQVGVHETRIVSESFTQGSPVTLGRGWSVSTLTYSLSAAVFALAVGSIMALDLVRSVPKLVAQTKPVAPTQTTTNSSTQQNSDNSNTNNGSGTPNTTTPTQTTPSTTTTPSQTYYNYQPPVSRVS